MSPTSKAKSARQHVNGGAKRPRHFYFWLVLGTAISLMSLLSMALEITGYKFEGWGETWLFAYANFVQKINTRLFGWINLWWMRISSIEGHIIIIGIVTLIAISYRALQNEAERPPSHETRSARHYLFVLFAAIFFFGLLLPLIILPGWWGAGLAVFNISFLAFSTFHSLSQ